MRHATSALAIVLIAFCASTHAQSRALPLAKDEQAPEFALHNLDAKTIKLSELQKSGPVVLIILRGWVGYQCPVCSRQMSEFLASAKEFEQAKASVVLVYPGPAAGLDAYAKQFIRGKTFPANFHFVMDPDLAFVNAYGLRWNAPRETAYPSTYVIQPGGKVTYAKVSQTHGGRPTAAEILKVLNPIPSP